MITSDPNDLKSIGKYPASVRVQLGSFRSQGGSSTTVDYTSRLAGLTLGGDGLISDHTRAGAFAGFSTAGLGTQGNGQDLYFSTFFGGAYLGHDMGNSFLDASFIAGHSSLDSLRNTANNRVPAGIGTASADYGGWLFSPSMKLGATMDTSGGILMPSVRLRYTSLFLDGYSETGSSASLTVAGRNIGFFDARAELAYALTPDASEHGSWAPAIRLGVDGTLSSGGNIDATLLAQSLNFSPAGSNALRGFAGLDATYQWNSNATFTLSTEAGYDTNKAFTGQASASFGLSF